MKVILPPLLILLLCFSTYTWGYTYLVPMNTDDGFCEWNDQTVRIGETFYNDDACERYICSDGNVDAAGCGSVGFDSDDPNCRLVRGEGNYPSCCPRPRCD